MCSQENTASSFLFRHSQNGTYTQLCYDKHTRTVPKPAVTTTNVHTKFTKHTKSMTNLISIGSMLVDALFFCNSSMKNMVDLNDKHIYGFLPKDPNGTVCGL